MKPHEMTLNQFISQAVAVKLENHGRKWSVHFDGDHFFSDAETEEQAKTDAHYGHCNNAVYFNDPENISLCPEGMLPSMPSNEVLEPYPDLLMWKIEMATDVASEAAAN